jgi:hypothetical protein
VSGAGGRYERTADGTDGEVDLVAEAVENAWMVWAALYLHRLKRRSKLVSAPPHP